jgi:hypothetical protein
MKRKITLLLLITISFIGTAQKKASIKDKISSKKIGYYYLPEIFTEIEHKTYALNLTDEKGKRYTFGVGTWEVSATGYISDLIVGGEDYSIKVKRMSSGRSSNLKKVITTSKSKKDADGKTIYYDVYSYEIGYTQKYKITIVDNLSDKSIVLDEEFTVETSSIYPKDFNTATITSKKGLQVSFASYVSKNDFNSKSDYKATIRSFNKHIKDILNSQIATKKHNTIVMFTKFKIKDKRFSGIDSTNFYLKSGFQLLNAQKEVGVFLNSHSKEIYNEFNKAYNVSKKFSNQKYIDMVETTSQAAYKYAVRLDLFMSAVFTSRYEKAFLLYKETKKQCDSYTGRATFKLIPEDKCLAGMDKMLQILERESKLFEMHNTVYNFYK